MGFDSPHGAAEPLSEVIDLCHKMNHIVRSCRVSWEMGQSCISEESIRLCLRAAEEKGLETFP